MRQLHTGIPQRLSSFPLPTQEVDIESTSNVEQEVIPVIMNFEPKLDEGAVMSSIFENRDEPHCMGQAYTDFKSSVFMAHHEHSAFYDPNE